MSANQVQQAIDALDLLADLRSKLDALKLSLEQDLNMVIPDNVKRDMEYLKLKYAPDIQTAEEQCAAVQSSVEAMVQELSVSVKGKFLMAVFSEGRITWNGKELAGFFKTMPELAEKFSKKGKPTVTIRRI